MPVTVISIFADDVITAVPYRDLLVLTVIKEFTTIWVKYCVPGSVEVVVFVLIAVRLPFFDAVRVSIDPRVLAYPVRVQMVRFSGDPQPLVSLVVFASSKFLLP